MQRRDLVPATIAAGCDMFLFFRNPEEDFGYMLDGYRNGVITAAAAARRAGPDPGAEGLPGPAPQAAAPSSCRRSRRWPWSAAPSTAPSPREIADKTVTLVKDTAGNLPITPARTGGSGCTASPAGADFTRADPLAYLDGSRRGAGGRRLRGARVPDRASSGRPPGRRA